MASNDVGALITILKTRYRVPAVLIEQMRLILTNDAIQQGNAMQYDRILAGMALALHRTFGFGAERIVRVLHEFDDIAGNLEHEGSWTEIMAELDDKTGIVFEKRDNSRFVMEYRGRNWKRHEEIENAAKKLAEEGK